MPFSFLSLLFLARSSVPFASLSMLLPFQWMIRYLALSSLVLVLVSRGHVRPKSLPITLRFLLLLPAAFYQTISFIPFFRCCFICSLQYDSTLPKSSLRLVLRARAWAPVASAISGSLFTNTKPCRRHRISGHHDAIR